MPRSLLQGLHLLALFALLAGCSALGRGGAADGVEVVEAFPARESYRMLGVVTATAYGFTSHEALLEQLKEAAAERGANALVLQGKVRETRDSRGHTTQEVAGWAISWEGVPKKAP